MAAAHAAHEVATRELENRHTTDSNVLRDEHATELANLLAEKTAELDAWRQQHANEVHELRGSHSRAMDEQNQNLSVATAAATAAALAAESEITKLHKELSDLRESLKFLQGKNDEDDIRHSKERNELERELASAKNEIDELREKVHVTPSNTCSCS